VSHAHPRAPDAAPSRSADAWPPGLEAAARAALPDFLLRQRWYPAKDAGRPEVAPATLVPFPVQGVPAAVAVWRVTPPGRPPMRLFVPLALVPAATAAAEASQVIAAPSSEHDRAGMQVVEAFSADAFVRAWVEMALRGGGEASGAGRLRTGRTEALAAAGLAAGGDWAIRRSGAEQSNTSIRVGERAILKVIRRLEEGVHPELEVGRFLTGQAGFAAAPAMLAWTELDGVAGAGTATLSVLQGMRGSFCSGVR
jgi:Maltokinase N-terminal cap domain